MPPAAALWKYLPPAGDRIPSDELLSRFLSYVTEKGLALYPAQEEAILELFADCHVILNTPTGSGKSLVAEALHFKALAEGKRSFYTCPIKALVNEKFFALCESFGPENVGMMTGDASVNRDAPIVCCTAEVLANLCLGQSAADVDCVVMDEFHYYADKERGVAWQLPLLSLPRTSFLLMSATLGTTDAIEQRLSALSGRAVSVVRTRDRPVPLDFEYRETPLHETIGDLTEQGMVPIYLVNFTQRAAAEEAQALTSVNLCTKAEKELIREALFDARFDTPYGKDLEKYLKHGIGLHHAGLLPRYRRLTERLAQKGLLKVVSGTDTLGMGVNIPIRTVLFTRLCKFDGEKVGILSVRDFHQIGGRAGRKGFDDRGLVVVQAPEHVIENKRLEAKAAGGRKVQKKQPPQKGYAHWDRATFDRLLTRPPEPLEPRFHVTHGILLTVLQAGELWPRGGYARLVELIARSHGDDYGKRKHRRRAALAFRALRQGGIIDLRRKAGERGCLVEVSPDLQIDFSLHHTLSLFLVAVLETLDRESPTYALDVVSCCEAILEDPQVVLWKQVDKLKDARIAELKAQGVPYEDRLAELEKVEPPRPLAPFLHGALSAFAERHPWVSSEDLAPKSVVRDLLERYATFNDYVKEYGLQRSEGVLLRYLTDAYKTLSQTVPEAARDDAVFDIVVYLRTMVRGVDSSLLDEWEELGEPRPVAPLPPLQAKPETPLDRLVKDPKAFAARVRNELHALLRLLAARDYEGALAAVRPLAGEPEWSADGLAQQMDPYFEEHGSVVLTPAARLPHNTLLTREGPGRWVAIQKILAPNGEDDWMVCAVVDVTVPPDDGTPLISLRRVGV